jgi:DNA-binding NarL/FixJ family response regulator
MTSERIRVMMVDDHPLLSEGLAGVIKNQHDMLPVGQASSGGKLLSVLTSAGPMSHSWICAFPT